MINLSTVTEVLSGKVFSFIAGKIHVLLCKNTVKGGCDNNSKVPEQKVKQTGLRTKSEVLDTLLFFFLLSLSDRLYDYL